MTVEAPTQVPAPPRALACRLASAAFAYPDAAWRRRFAALCGAVRSAGALPEAGLAGLEAALAAVSPDSLAAEHFRLFGPAPACPLELAFHATKEPTGQARTVADLAGFYKAFGLESGERADGLPAALEFLGYLEVKRAHAELRGWGERRDVAVEASARLRAEVLAKTVRAFARRLRAAGAPEFYRQAAGLGLSLIGGSR